MRTSVRRAAVALVLGCSTVLALAAPARGDDPDLSGTVVDHDTGAGVPGACVVLLNTDDNTEWATACTDDAGQFAVPVVARGQYRLRIRADGYPEQWAISAPNAENARLFGLGEVPFTGLTVPLWRGAGTIRGRVTDAHGAAVPASIQVHRDDESWVASTQADADGRYELAPVPPGMYWVRFEDARHGVQYAHGKFEQFSADRLEIVDGGVTVVDEQYRPLPTVVITVTDSLSGRPVAGVCAGYITFASDTVTGCAGTDGVITFVDVAADTLTAFVHDPAAVHYDGSVDNQTLQPGTNRFPVRLGPAAAIRSTVVDAASGQPVSACVAPVDAHGHGFLGPRFSDCSDPATGQLVIGQLPPGDWNLFANPVDEDTVHGAQWVGPGGGTGDQRRAVTVRLALRQSVSLPPIRLDGAGSISGTVLDRATGAPVPQVCAFPYAFDPRLGSDGLCTDTTGRYTVTGLGPYDWPVEYVTRSSINTMAWEWSGDVADRFSARLVRVRAGGTTTLDAHLVAGATVPAIGDDGSGTEPFVNDVVAYSVRTGDFASFPTSSPADPGPGFTIRRLATQQVRIGYTIAGHECFYDRTRAYAGATQISVTAGRAAARIVLRDCGAPAVRSDGPDLPPRLGGPGGLGHSGPPDGIGRPRRVLPAGRIA